MDCSKARSTQPIDQTPVATKPAARVTTENVFLEPWSPNLDFSSLVLAACARMTMAWLCQIQKSPCFLKALG